MQPPTPTSLFGQEISGLLEAASQALDPNDMIHTEAFSMFEAMSAVEVGNPKMDSASAPNISAAAWIEKGSAPTDLTLGQQLTVAESVMCNLYLYLCQGAPAASSVYSSLYMLQPLRWDASCTPTQQQPWLPALLLRTGHVMRHWELVNPAPQIGFKRLLKALQAQSIVPLPVYHPSLCLFLVLQAAGSVPTAVSILPGCASCVHCRTVVDCARRSYRGGGKARQASDWGQQGSIVDGA